MDLDLIVQNATIVTATEVLQPGLSIGIKAGIIVAIALFLPAGPQTTVIDAEGAYVTPGGVDTHVHLDQDNAPTGDKWLSGSRSALAGGNTTILAFATQRRTDESLFPVVEEYHNRARNQSYVDYGFHLILTRPTESILENELQVMVEREGITSVKLYMTYPAMKLGDGDMLEIMMRARQLGMTTMIHAENSDMIDMITTRLLKYHRTQPKYHAIARPQIAEAEATNRAISLATVASTPILIVHMSSPVALSHARKAQSKSLLPVHAETCPHYLYLLSSQLAATSIATLDEHGHSHELEDEWAGARHVCAPPLRHSEDDLQSVWDSVNNGTITVISSDHAPSLYNSAGGKRKPLVDAKATNSVPTFVQIPNGLPGVETRLPILFSAATDTSAPAARRLSLPRFVELTSTNPAKMYGLAGKKGSIAPGYDADLVIWYPSGHADAATTVSNGLLHHCIDYTPFEGIKVCNWPRFVVLRGEVKWNRDVELSQGHGEGILGQPTDGQFLKRAKGQVLVGRLGQTPPGMMAGELNEWMEPVP
ncbi:dihydropyrimidinase [Capronia epimyces CBS 606.96]|uniref:dihydropyrimidinase n=1 Tax=Capronia epimyces CBS 606.96 TaxID=1182542 RepID=W9YQM5_9EURO|nr:dihydropyrimidinase [Capronia epimyces CBS 606.96]EXJ91955.1 dihydropyrimidinase [Capronia epimyces CBS 606.96]